MADRIRIYFGCSINGGRQRAHLYPAIVGLLERHGEVISRSFADQSITAEEGDNRTADDIFCEDVGWLMSADVAIMETSVPSTGLGYELGRIEQRGMTHLCIHGMDAHPLSKMVTGNPKMRVCHYHSLADLDRRLHAFFAGVRVGIHR